MQIKRCSNRYYCLELITNEAHNPAQGAPLGAMICFLIAFIKSLFVILGQLAGRLLLIFDFIPVFVICLPWLWCFTYSFRDQCIFKPILPYLNRFKASVDGMVYNTVARHEFLIVLHGQVFCSGGF